jgi:rubrerythrin
MIFSTKEGIMDLLPILENISGEIDAIKLYTKAIEQSTDPTVIEVLTSIRDEEKVHVGELMYLAMKVSPELASKFLEGCKEVKEIVGDMD